MSKPKNITALILAYITVGYNILEGLVSVFFGYSGGSLALAGFGLDSFIESMSGGIMIWRFKERKGLTHEEEERIESRAIKMVAMAFYALGIYVLINSSLNLYRHSAPEQSLAGIIIAIVS